MTTVTIGKARKEEKKALRLAIIAPLMIILAMMAKDVAMVIINNQHECALDTMGGRSKYVTFNLSTWMYVASAFHMFAMFSMWLVFLSLALDDDYEARRFRGEARYSEKKAIELIKFTSVFLTSLNEIFFLFPWTMVGFLLQEEIREYGVNKQQCGDVILGWLVLQVLLETAPCFLTICCICASAD